MRNRGGGYLSIPNGITQMVPSLVAGVKQYAHARRAQLLLLLLAAVDECVYIVTHHTIRVVEGASPRVVLFDHGGSCAEELL